MSKVFICMVKVVIMADPSTMPCSFVIQLLDLLLDSHTSKKPERVQTNYKQICKRLYVCNKVLLTLLLCKCKADQL